MLDKSKLCLTTSSKNKNIVYSLISIYFLFNMDVLYLLIPALYSRNKFINFRSKVLNSCRKIFWSNEIFSRTKIIKIKRGFWRG